MRQIKESKRVKGLLLIIKNEVAFIIIILVSIKKEKTTNLSLLKFLFSNKSWPKQIQINKNPINSLLRIEQKQYKYKTKN
mgnify:CR=1 FL=1